MYWEAFLADLQLQVLVQRAPARIAAWEEGTRCLVDSSMQVQARSRGFPAREETLQQVCQHIALVVRSLPKDLRAILCGQETASAI